MPRSAAIAAVVEGAPGAELQDLFRTLVARWRPDVRVAGVIAEPHGLADRRCRAGYLRDVRTGARYSIFDDIGPGSTACHLTGGGALAAAEAVRRDVAAGCDLVVLSKFGKLEAGGAGLFAAFEAAVGAGVPVLTTLAPASADAWTRLAGPGHARLPADAEAIEAWRRATTGAPTPSP